MKDKTSAGVLALLVGGLGVHKFYLGQTGAGVAYLLFCWTGIPFIISVVEGISMLSMSQGAFDAKYNGMMLMPGNAQPQAQNIVVNVSSPSGGGGGGDVATQLKALHELKLAGVLTDEEFAAQKKKLLS